MKHPSNDHPGQAEPVLVEIGSRKRSAPAPVSAPSEPAPLELDQVRETLAAANGRHFWRSLDEFASTGEFQELLHREFPRQAAEWDDSVSRRHFLQLAGAGLALAGLTGCTRQPEERLVPFVRQPEDVIPGRPLYFATAASLGGYATGVLAESHMGRPTKLEGNPEHPASLGSTDLMTQAEPLALYDPDRSKAVTHLGLGSTWDALVKALEGPLAAQAALGGVGLRILSGNQTSPTLAAQVAKVQQRFPSARWIQYEPVGREVAHRGAELAFGERVEIRYDLTAADVIVTLDADLLSEGPGHVRYAKQFAARRRVHETGGEMPRLYSLESSPTNTGTLADHRLPLRPAEIGGFTLALAGALGVPGVAAGATSKPEVEQWVRAIAADLGAHRGRSLVVAGEYTSPALHAVAHAINAQLGNLGTTVLATDPVAIASGDRLVELRQLVADMAAGKVDLLFVLGANPLFDAPSDLGFQAAFEKVATRVHLGLYDDETAEYCHWHVHQAHFLEGWSDARAFDGTVSIVQPLIEPLYGGKTIHEVVALLSGELGQSSFELVREHWRAAGLGDAEWRKAVHDGVVPGSALLPRAVSLAAAGVATAAATLASESAGREDLVLVFRPDPSLYDGRYSNNGWLQEIPKPITKLTWDNALLIAPATVRKLQLVSESLPFKILPRQLHGEEAKAAHLIAASGLMVRLTAGGRELEVPIWVMPGQAEGVLTLHLGFGRRRAGRVGNGAGFDAYSLRTAEAPWQVAGVSLAATGDRYQLASTQMHNNIVVETEEAHKRHLVRTAAVETYRQNPNVIQDMGHAEMAKLSMYPPWEYNGYAWGMAIDLSSCLGCNACLVACQAENNIPVVGKDQVARGREMLWLRIDRYFEGENLDNPRIHHQPLPCQQCEQAPCEVVCPVAATVHSQEGLNDMVYNRCVGTRYCSNNCPYKVRRFNFLKYNETTDPVLAMVRNPDVSVRFRGVMEKCTYCVQRIKGAKIDSRVEGRQVRDGEIVTACQQACPTDAISFGDANDEASKVRRWKDSNLNYALLEELGTRPRTTYLAKLRNPNPELERS